MAVPGPTGRGTGQRGHRWGSADPKADASGDVLVTELYRRYHAPLLSFVLRLTAGDRQHAEDIVQETMLRAWRQAAKFDQSGTSPPSLMPWLATVARRIVIDEQRKRNARPMETDDAMLTKASVPDWTDALLRSVIVADAMLELSPAHREILNETILRDRTVNEAAEVLGIPVGTVKSRVYYAIRALRLVLAEREVSL
jgi:RNA polymerase sigma-70 factor (ECF subfamily)